MTRFIEDCKYDFKDVLILPKRSSLASRSEVSLQKEYTFLNSCQSYSGIPIVAANMDGVGTFEMAKCLADYGLFTALSKHYSSSELIAFFTSNSEWAVDHVAYSMGITDDDLAKQREFKNKAYVKYLCVDVANGYQESFVQFISNLRKENKHSVIIAGNVVTPEITEALLFAGADIVKVGIGPGSACSTRIKTGVGYPQLSAIIECADAAHGLGGHIISDGGCTCPGDISKAFAGNADFVMLGGMFAGCDEGGGQVITKRYQTNQIMSHESFGSRLEQTIEFYGMSSKKAMETHTGEVADYRASEGRVLSVPYKGKVDNVIKDILGGIRSCCTYTGSKSLKELPKRATFVKVTQQFNAAFGIGEV